MLLGCPNYGHDPSVPALDNAIGADYGCATVQTLEVPKESVGLKDWLRCAQPEALPQFYLVVVVVVLWGNCGSLQT